METGQADRHRAGSAQDSEYWLFASVGILSILFLLDVLTTDIILAGGGIEYNPLMAGIVQNPVIHIVIKLLVLVLVFLAAKYSEAILRGSSSLLFITIIGWYILCVGNNLGSILRVASLG